jgi:DNA-binding LacI/PurR family transcriptional regulator
MSRAPSSVRVKIFVSSTEVARLAGVSQSAVSRTFTPGASVSLRTREKVLAAATELGYHPNNLPRIMQTGRSHLIGVVIGAIENPYYAAVLDRFAHALQAAGQQVVLVRHDTGLALDGVLSQLAAYRVDAVLTAIPVRTDKAAEALSGLRIPIVCFNAHITADRVFSIKSGNYEAGVEAARLLYTRGARKFAFIGAPPIHAASTERRTGFKSGLQELGCSPPVERTGNDDYASGFSTATELFSTSHHPDGLFCSNDLMACGALDAMRLVHGIKSPHDVLVTGYDNIPQADWSGYALTSFDQQPDKMIATALDLIADCLDGSLDADAPRMRIIPARLLERASTAGQIAQP